jgi:quercetin dioxygenase-like cupin family protein
MMKTQTRIATATCFALLLGACATVAQAPAIKRTLLQKSDVGHGMEAILGLAEIAVGGSTGRHTHFGVETGYVIEGNGTLEIDGQPTLTLKPGDSYTIPAGTVHNAKAIGPGATKVLATYIVEKGKPLATPAP